MSESVPRDAAIAPVAVSWLAREPPLEPSAALGVGHVAIELARRIVAEDLVDRPDRPLWTGVAGTRSMDGSPVLVLLGEDLPWVEGACFFAVDRKAPSLLLPTRLYPSVPVGLLQRIATARRLAAPVLVVPPDLVGVGGEMLISAGEARQVDTEKLRSQIASWTDETKRSHR